jgi:predicted secreted protein
MFKAMVIIAAAGTLAASATAQTVPPDPASPSSAQQKSKDPNRMICEKQEELGSRLGGKKVCKTAAEWQEWRQQNRDQLEEWQRQHTNPGTPAG